MAKTIHTDKAPAAIGPYVQGKIVGNLLFASGQVKEYWGYFGRGWDRL